MLPEIHDLEKLNMTLAERFIQWEKALGQKGYLEGMERAIKDAMQLHVSGPVICVMIRRDETLPSVKR